MAKIRFAVEQDIPTLVGWGEKFWEHTWFKQELDQEYCGQSVAFLLQGLMNDDHGFVLVVEDEEQQVRGFALIAVSPFVFNLNRKMAGELAWYVDPEYRGHRAGLTLLKKAELVAQRRGCDYLSMISMNHSMNVGPLYEKVGYSPAETTYIKEL
jgi:GNAT superfamily N-acetyltransferase